MSVVSGRAVHRRWIRVAVADSDPEVREALTDLVDSHPASELVGPAVDNEWAVTVALEARPQVLVLSAYTNPETAFAVLATGAVGYLVKGTPAAEVMEAITRAADGQFSMPVPQVPGVRPIALIDEKPCVLPEHAGRVEQLFTLGVPTSGPRSSRYRRSAGGDTLRQSRAHWSDRHGERRHGDGGSGSCGERAGRRRTTCHGEAPTSGAVGCEAGPSVRGKEGDGPAVLAPTLSMGALGPNPSSLHRPHPVRGVEPPNGGEGAPLFRGEPDRSR